MNYHMFYNCAFRKKFMGFDKFVLKNLNFLV